MTSQPDDDGFEGWPDDAPAAGRPGVCICPAGGPADPHCGNQNCQPGEEDGYGPVR